jgi:tetraacyldisaccharide 4'-kinase
MKRPWLLPLVPLYGAGLALRSAGLRSGLVPSRRLRWPVISVGNLSVGGTGKTPFTIALAKLLLREGIHVDVLSRGYGRQGTEVERVNTDGAAEQFGDEPLLIARETGVPVYVGATRWQAGILAEEQAGSETGVHLLDDGFQHRQLLRLADIVLLNSEDMADSLLPAGNLREGLGALKRARVLAVPQEDESAMDRLRQLGFESRPERPIWRFRREMVVPEMPETFAGQPFVAFCGIARPKQFFAGLAQKGIQIAASRAFPDHHPFTKGDVEMLRELAESNGSGALITTAKDLVRLGALGTARNELENLNKALPIFAADLRVVLEDEPGASLWLRRALGLTAN